MQNTSQQINKSPQNNSQILENHSNQIEHSFQLKYQQSPIPKHLGQDIDNQKQIAHHLHDINDIQCRICLQNNNIRDANSFVQLPYIMSPLENPLISPCRCSGSLKNIHVNCLKQWIESQLNNSLKKLKIGVSQIQCQLCTQRIYFTTQKRLHCKSKQQIKKYFLKNIKNFVLLMLLLLINLGFFSALLNYLLFVGFTALITNNAVLVSLIISGEVIFSIVSVVTMVCIINRYLFARKIIVKDILENPNKMGRTVESINVGNKKMEEELQKDQRSGEKEVKKYYEA